MMPGVGLSQEHLARVRAVAAILLPGTPESSPAADLEAFDTLVQQAALAVDGEGRGAPQAIEALPDEITRESLSAFAETDRSLFEEISLLALGAYFMSPEVLGSLGLPSGERKRADPEQAVDELSTGILDPVFERGCPVRTLEQVAGAGHDD